MLKKSRNVHVKNEGFDTAMLEKIKKDVRQENFDTLLGCSSSIIAFNIIIDFLSVFPKFGQQASGNAHIHVEHLEPDPRKKIKYFIGILVWLAKMMNKIVPIDSIQEEEQIEECYRLVVTNLIPAELIGKVQDASSPRNATKEEQIIQLIEKIKTI